MKLDLEILSVGYSVFKTNLKSLGPVERGDCDTIMSDDLCSQCSVNFTARHCNFAAFFCILTFTPLQRLQHCSVISTSSPSSASFKLDCYATDIFAGFEIDISNSCRDHKKGQTAPAGLHLIWWSWERTISNIFHHSSQKLMRARIDFSSSQSFCFCIFGRL